MGINLGYDCWKAVRQTPPQRTIRKRGDWLMHRLLRSPAVAVCLAGTAETQWHLAGTSVNPQ